MEKQDELETQKQNNKDIFTKEEENLLDDLDLDF